MIENINEIKPQIKQIWLEHKEDMLAKDIFKNYLTPYFDGQVPGKDWVFFIKWIGEWKIEERKKNIEGAVETLSDEQAEELQNKNRKRAVVMLSAALDRVQEKPSLLKKMDVLEIRKLMKMIEDIGQARERTKIQKGKLNLDAIRTFFPYQRMSIEDLEQLKEQIINAITEVKQLKQGEAQPAGQGPAGTGGA